MANPTTLEERLQILGWSKAGLADSQIAGKIDRSIHTVRKWRRRGTRLGRGALASGMGRPAQGALRSFPEAIRERLLAWRKAHPGWGPKTLRAELLLEAFREDFGGALPSRSSIARFLKEEGLINPLPREALRSAGSPGSKRHGGPPALWEMDAKGNEKVAGV